MARRRSGPAIAALLLLGALATASVASAARVSVNAGALDTFTVGHPCFGTLAATTPTTTGTSSSVEVTPPEACAGRTITVAVNDGTVVRQGTTTAPASGSVIVTLSGAYTPSTTTQVAATVSGWHLDTSWSYTPPEDPPPATGPITPGNDQTVITAIDWTISNSNQACAEVTVTTNTAQNSWWRVNLNIDQAPFYGATSGYQLGGGPVEFVPGSGTAVNGVLGIQGSNNGWGRLSQGSTRTFTVCHYGLPSPPDDPSAYSVTYSQGTWSDTQACVRATITGNGSSEFYFGWSAQIDMTPAFERIESSGREVRRLQQDTWGNIVQYSPAFSPSVSTYDLTHLWQGVLRLSESRTVGICAYEY